MNSNHHRDLSPSEGDGEDAARALLPRRKLVVVIGIDDYWYLPKLRCAVSDALGMQGLLVSRFGFETPIPPLTNQAASKRAIETLIEDDLRKLLRPDDALVLFFAGHGTTRQNALGNLTVETGYLAPVEARSADHFSEMLDMEELLRKIGLLQAHHILVILDACHSGVALGSAMSQYRSMGNFVNQLMGNRSRRVITSARRNEPALDSGPVPGHSLFTGAMIQALASGAADLDRNGIVTFSELALCLQQMVGQASGSRQTPDYGAFHLDDRGELILAASGPALEQLRIALPPPPRRAGKRGRNPAIWAASAGLFVLVVLAIVFGASRSAREALICLSASSCRERADEYAKGDDLPKDDARAVELYRKACDGGDAKGCSSLARRYADGGGVTKDEARAVALFRKGCDGGDLEGCTNLGYHYMNGLGIAKDDARGAELFRKSCDGGIAAGCANLAMLTMDGRGGIAKDEARGAELLRKACDSGSFYGCAGLGFNYMSGKGVPKDDTRAAEYSRKACDGGDPVGCLNLGVLHKNGRGVPRDEARAAELYQKSCDGGEPQACGALGVLYAEGRGVGKDLKRSVELYRRGCDGGNASSCTLLGAAYKDGEGVPREFKRAVELYNKACNGNDMLGCSFLGGMYEDGEGVAADTARAIELYRRACDAGIGHGCTGLGYAYEKGRGVPPDIARAVELYRKACDAGNWVGCHNMGVMVQTGRGVLPDPQRAKNFYRKACEGGYTKSCEALGRLGN